MKKLTIGGLCVAAAAVALTGCASTGNSVAEPPATSSAASESVAPASNAHVLPFPGPGTATQCQTTSWASSTFETCNQTVGGGHRVDYVQVWAKPFEGFPRNCRARAHIWQNSGLNLNGPERSCDYWRDQHPEVFQIRRNVNPGLLCAALIFSTGDISKAACTTIQQKPPTSG